MTNGHQPWTPEEENMKKFADLLRDPQGKGSRENSHADSHDSCGSSADQHVTVEAQRQVAAYQNAETQFQRNRHVLQFPGPAGNPAEKNQSPAANRFLNPRRQTSLVSSGIYSMSNSDLNDHSPGRVNGSFNGQETQHCVEHRGNDTKYGTASNPKKEEDAAAQHYEHTNTEHVCPQSETGINNQHSGEHELTADHQLSEGAAKSTNQLAEADANHLGDINRVNSGDQHNSSHPINPRGLHAGGDNAKTQATNSNARLTRESNNGVGNNGNNGVGNNGVGNNEKKKVSWRKKLQLNVHKQSLEDNSSSSRWGGNSTTTRGGGGGEGGGGGGGGESGKEGATGDSRSTYSSSGMRRASRRSQHLALLFLVVTLVFVLSWIPPYLAMVWYFHVGYTLPMSSSELAVQMYAPTGYVLNSFANPVIYAIFSRQFRHYIVNLWKACTCTVARVLGFD
jgi:hypothetical protein